MYSKLCPDDFRAIYGLLGECRELWIDPEAWQRHLLSNLSQFIALPFGLVIEVEEFQSGRPPRVIHAVAHGWKDASMQTASPETTQPWRPFLKPLDLRARNLGSRGGLASATRANLLSDTEWRGGDTFEECFAPARMDEMVYSAVPMAPGSDRHHVLIFGGPDYQPTERDRQRLAFLHRELVPLIGTRLATSASVCAHGLSARRRQVLDLAAAGLPEKLIADQLGLRPSTVNEYLQSIYLHFSVHTRSELMAYLLHRSPVRHVNRRAAPLSRGCPTLRRQSLATKRRVRI